jgi:hypothetical protein
MVWKSCGNCGGSCNLVSVVRPIYCINGHDYFRRPHRGIFDPLTHIPDPLIPLAIVVLVGLGLKALYGRSLSNHQSAAFVCSLSVIVAESIKDQLKFIFGRTWPETWVQNNPSFIHDGVYGFNFMRG